MRACVRVSLCMCASDNKFKCIQHEGLLGKNKKNYNLFIKTVTWNKKYI